MRESFGTGLRKDGGMHPANLLTRLDRAVMPRCCAFCGVRCEQDERYVCSGCKRDLRYSDRCVEAAPPFGAVIAPMAYAFPVDAAIKALKFRRKLFYVPAFVELMIEATAHLPASADALLPVPLHWWRHVMRGFNQSDELCKSLRKATGLPVTRAVKRVRATPSQTGLSAPQRKANLRGAFRLARKVRARHIVIVDDVITTGATARAVAQVLLDAGVDEVSLLVLARA